MKYCFNSPYMALFYFKQLCKLPCPVDGVMVKKTKCKDNTMKKGIARDFFPNKTHFHLEKKNGEISEISVEDLKAVFFVKDFEGNKTHQYSYDDNIAGGGKKIKVRFFDGETVVGYTLGYSPDRQGFFLTPADLQGNNERIFVVRSATEKIEFL